MIAAVPFLSQRRRASPVDARSLPAFRLIAAQIVVIVAMTVATGFGYDGRDINAITTLIAFAILTGFGLRRLGVARLATAIEAMALVLASGVTVACLSILVASGRAPLVDPMLAAADRFLFPFMSWRGMVFTLAPYTGLVRAMCTIYSTLLWQPFVLVAALALTGREDAVWRFVHAWLLTLTICVTIFAIAPAVSPYIYYGVGADQIPALTVKAAWRPAEILGHVRDGSLHELASATMSGLITFPSFHTAGAVLLGWGFRRVPVVGWLFVAIDALMLATVPMIGSHYFVDVLAGVCVAAATIALSGRFGSRARPEMVATGQA